MSAKTLATLATWNSTAEKLLADPSGLIPLRDAAAILRATASAANRWVIHGKDGVRLEAVWVGRGWVTTREAVGRFIAEVSRMASGRDAPFADAAACQSSQAGDSPLGRERRARAAMAELEKLMGRKGSGRRTRTV